MGEEVAWVHKSAKINTRLAIGRFSYINSGCVFGGRYPVAVGAFCSIAADVYCWTYESHAIDRVTSSPLKTILGLDIGYSEIVEKPQGVTIGHDVYIGHRVRIMPGITIGTGCVIAAGAIVTKDCEPYGVYGGVPAKLIKKRFNESIIAQLLTIQWWHWPLDKIERNLDFFNLPLADMDEQVNLSDWIVEP